MVLLQIRKGGMRLYDHVFAERDLKLGLEVCGSLCFGLAAAIGEEDERDLLILKVGESFMCTGYGVGGADEDTIDTVNCQYASISASVGCMSYSKAKPKSGILLCGIEVW